MQITQHVSLAFVDYSVPNKLVFGEKVHNAFIAGAATFPNLPHLPAAIKTANDDLAAKAAAAANGDKVAMDARDASEAAWKTLMKDNAKYVETVANGNLGIIDKSGYLATKDRREGRQAPANSQSPQTSVDGLVGGMKLSVEPDTNVDAFLFTARTSGVTVQQQGNQITFSIGVEKVIVVIDTHRQVTLTGLTSHVPLQVQIMGVNNAGCNQLTNAKTTSPQ